MTPSFKSLRVSLALFLIFLLLGSRPMEAYSVLSHEEVVDMAWPKHIVPLLRARYPNLSDDDLRTAHAYAYGGSVIQDIGYYPFGNHEFSDLLHYARTGAFVSALITDSANLNEYAFALGALAHYCGDVNGHPVINQVTADEYPKLKSRFGQVVTYAENPVAHVRTEFGFDVVEVAHGRYSQQNYRDFVGFQVAKELMNRAFLETYGFPVSSLMKNEDLAIGSYRRAVSGLIPKMTTVALVNYKEQIEKENPGFDSKKFLYRLHRTEYEKDYGKQYAHPGVGSEILAHVIDFIPKVGPFKVFALNIPTPSEQDLYLKSINKTVDNYNQDLGEIHLRDGGEVAKPPILAEIDLDTGKEAHLGEYRLADQTYAALLERLVSDPGKPIPSDIRHSIADFYSVRNQPAWYLKKPKQWQKLKTDLAVFDAAPERSVASDEAKESDGNDPS